MPFQLPRIYPITDLRFPNPSHADQVDQLIAGGAEIIQLREKRQSAREFYEAANACAMIANAHGVCLIVNDRVDIALAIGAAGVHLGQDDIPPAEARSILGKNAVIGFSTHTVAQVRAALNQPVNYIAIGPIFTTQTKQGPDKIVGLDGLRSVRDAIGDLPLVAIGGITMENLSSVVEAGADSAAVIGAMFSDPAGIVEQMRKFKSMSEIKR